MPDELPYLPEGLVERIATVTNKRARFVLDSIVANGLVTTEEINREGYDHPPRAAQDVRDLGFRLKTIKVKHSNGRSIAAYVFDEVELEVGKEGRRLLPKKERDALIHGAGDKCQICGGKHNLQVDHRIPYERGHRRRRIERSVTRLPADGSPAPQFSSNSPLLKTNELEKSHRPGRRRITARRRGALSDSLRLM